MSNNLENAGKEIAQTLGLKQIKSGEQAGRFNAEGGTKTHVGLANTMIRILEDNGIKVTV